MEARALVPNHSSPAKGPARSTILLLGGIAALGSLATQLLVPALPSIASEMNIGVASTQLIISVFLICLGGGQLILGPISDRVDRKKLLITGLLIYAVGSLIGAISAGLGVLLLARIAQAIGGSAGIVTARILLNAMVPPEKAVSAQASLMTIILISPALAPVIGGFLTEYMGWRTIMICLCLAGLIGAVVALWKIPAQPSAATSTAPMKVRQAYAKVLRNRRFRAASATMALSSATFYVFLASAPFLLEADYHLSPREMGLCLLLVASMSIAGTRIVSRVQRRMNPMKLGTGLALLSALLIAAISIGSHPPIGLLLMPLALLGLTAGMIGPTAIVHIIASEPGLEGTATSMGGAAQMGGGAIIAWFLSPYAAQGPLNLAFTLIPLALCGVGTAIATERACRT